MCPAANNPKAGPGAPVETTEAEAWTGLLGRGTPKWNHEAEGLGRAAGPGHRWDCEAEGWAGLLGPGAPVETTKAEELGQGCAGRGWT